MARPTDEKKGKMIKIRISEELYDGLSQKGTNLSETIRKILKDSFVPQNKGEKNQNSGLAPSKEVKEIESMAVFFGFTLDEMLKMIYNGLNDGYLTVEDGKIVGLPGVDLDNLKEACHERGIGMQEAIDKTVKSLRSGK